MKPYRLILLSLALTLCSTLLYAAVPTISYTPSAYTFTYGTPITTVTPTLGNAPTSFTISGSLSLPAGLTFNTTNGQISGTPTEVRLTPETYTITASNASGSSTPATITIQVNKADQRVSFPRIFDKLLQDGSFTIHPMTNAALAFTYESTNTDVATIDPTGVVTLKKEGITNIRISNSGDANYNPVTVSRKLVVGQAPVISISDQTFTVNSPASAAVTSTGGIIPPTQKNTDTIANRNGTPGDDIGKPIKSSFNYPILAPRDINGDFYIFDTRNTKVKKLNFNINDTTTTVALDPSNYYPRGCITPSLNNGLIYSSHGGYELCRFKTLNGYTNIKDIYLGTLFYNSYDFAVNSNDELFYINNNRIMKIDANGKQSIYAGTTNSGFKDGALSTALFDNPNALVFDEDENLYISEGTGCRIRKIDTRSADPQVSTIAGDGSIVNANGNPGKLYYPSQLYLDRFGKFLIVYTNGTIYKKIALQGGVSDYSNRFIYSDYTNFDDDNGYSYSVKGHSIVRTTKYGYSITPSLPATGLSFDAITGTISGTPTAGFGSTFTITATNAFGTASTSFTLTVNRLAQTITLPTSKTITYGDPTDQLPTTSDQGLAVSYTTSPTGIVSIGTDGKITVLKAGTVTISAKNNATSVYNALPSTPTTLTINKKTLSSSNLTHSLTTLPATISKEYDGMKNVPGTFTAQATGVVPGETVTLTATGSYTSSSVGNTKAIIVKYTLDATSATKYLPPADTQLDGKITPARLSVTTTVSSNGIKTYNGNRNAIITNGSLSGFKLSTDQAKTTLNVVSAMYESKDASSSATNKITVTYSLSGDSAKNYDPPVDYYYDGKILPFPLTVSPPTIPTKTKPYDGTNALLDGYTKTALSGTYPDIIDYDITSCAYTSPNVVDGKIQVQYAIASTVDPAIAKNYTAPLPVIITGSGITPRKLILNPPTVLAERPYDGTTTTKATANSTPFINLIPGDAVSPVFGSAVYDSKDASDNPIGVTVSFGLQGNNTVLNNYTAPDPIKASAYIRKVQLTIGEPFIPNKIKDYDGTTTGPACWPNSDLKLIVGSEKVTASVKSATYDSPDAGEGTKSITVEYELDGNDKKNYLAPEKQTISGATIKKWPLTISGTKPNIEKVYDGKTEATVSPSNVGTIDNLPPKGSIVTPLVVKAYYKNSTAESGKDVIVEYDLEGSGKTNYEPPKPKTLYGVSSITPKPLEVEDPTFTTSTGKNKVYSSSNNLPKFVVGAFKNAEGEDAKNLILEAPNAYYGGADDPGVDVGSHDITIEYKLSGMLSTNYIKPVPYKGKGQITPKQLYITGTKVADKNYDGTFTATATPGTLYVVEPYDVGIVYPEIKSATYKKADVGTQEVDIVYGLIGDKSGNYLAPLPETKTGIIKSNQLVIDKLDFVSSKPYDGDRGAKVNTATALTDDGKTVTLTTTATYDNANAGSQKITFTFSLEGTDKDKYIAPAPFSRPGEITPVKLKVEGFQVQTNKITDGTSDAKVLNNGTLIGVIPSEAGLVKHQTTAKYLNDITPGKALKTILVNFTCTGITSNYEAPDNVSISGALISEVITLNLSPVVGAGCDGYIKLPYTITSGDPTDYQINFSDEAKTAGIRDIATTLLPSLTSGEIMIDIPKTTSSGHYKGTLVAKNALGESTPYAFYFDVNVATNLIVSKFNAEVICDNSSRQYKAYQWYKNGNVINGANQQYYEDPEGLVGTYTVLVTNNKGESVMSCPRYFNFPIQKSLKVYPSPVQKLHQCKIDLSQLKADELENAVMTIYTPQGVKVYETTSVSSENYFKPLQTGVYVGTVMLKNGFRYNFSIIAKE